MRRMPLESKQAAQIKAFGRNVRRERMARKITQEKLAELVDLNIRTVQKIEAGQPRSRDSFLSGLKLSATIMQWYRWTACMPSLWVNGRQRRPVSSHTHSPFSIRPERSLRKASTPSPRHRSEETRHNQIILP